MPEINDFNTKVIEEFRANKGVVGGPFAGAPVLLLHTKGAKTGQARVNPLVYRPLGDDVAIFASKGGAPGNPDWFRNLVANPVTTIELGEDTIDVRARVAEGEERARVWEQQKRDAPQFAEYEKATSRQIPVVILERT